METHKPPKQNNPAIPTFWILGTCNVFSIGIGITRSITSVTIPATGGRMKSKCLFPQWPGRSGIQFFSTGIQMRASAKKFPNHHRPMMTPTIVVQVRNSGCTKILRKRSRIESFVAAIMVGWTRPTVYHSEDVVNITVDRTKRLLEKR